MLQVNYNEQILDGYELLHNGNLYPIPFLFTEKQAHKMLDRQERSERRWEWMQKHDWLLGLIFVVIGTVLVVWWQL
jgi:hypothetical protein